MGRIFGTFLIFFCKTKSASDTVLYGKTIPENSKQSGKLLNILKILGNSCIDYYESEIHFIGIIDSFKNLLEWNNDFYNQDDLCKDQLILTSSSVSRDYDYALRMFGTKNLGVIEDPVTGSAQPPIFSYWSEELKKENFCVYQASERGGLMQVKRDIRGIDVNGKVKLVKQFYQEI